MTLFHSLKMASLATLIFTPIIGFTNDNQHPVTFMIETATTNDSLIGSDSLAHNEAIGMSQDITSHFYYSLESTLPSYHEIDSEVDVGAHTSLGRFNPLCELEIVNTHSNHQDVVSLDYDFGTTYALTPRLSPLLIMDGLGLDGGNQFIYGANYQLSHNVAVSIEGMKIVGNTGSGADLKLFYTL